MTEKKQSSTVVDETILDAIRNLRYGRVEVVVHDSRVVQVEKTEKIRFDAEVTR